MADTIEERSERGGVSTFLWPSVEKGLYKVPGFILRLMARMSVACALADASSATLELFVPSSRKQRLTTSPAREGRPRSSWPDGPFPPPPSPVAPAEERGLQQTCAGATTGEVPKPS